MTLNSRQCSTRSRTTFQQSVSQTTTSGPSSAQATRLFCFFFSSRRRHTRCGRDWSSDVCSSDLEIQLVAAEPDIHKPMNLAFDDRGRLWVTSTVEYPFPASGRTPRDTIQVLEEDRKSVV